MASDGNPGSSLITSLVPGSLAAPINSPQTGGKIVPGGNNAPSQAGSSAGSSGAAEAAAKNAAAASGGSTQRGGDPQSLVNSLNKFLNDSGRPDQFRIAPASRNTLIQEINPANGQVIGEFSVAEFPALARSIGAAGLLIDSRA